MSAERGSRRAAAMVVAGIVLALAPLLGTVWSVLTLIGAHTGAPGAAGEPTLPWRPIAAGFVVFPFGLFLLALSVRRYGNRLKAGRTRSDMA